MDERFVKFMIGVLISIMLISCTASQADVVATGTDKASPATTIPVALTSTETPQPTLTYTAIPSPSPTNTAAPTSTKSPPSTATIAASPSPLPTQLGGGGKIAFTSNREGEYQIYTMDPDGSAQTQLTNLVTNNFFPELSPDGDLIIYWAVDSTESPPIAEYRIATSDGSHHEIFGPGMGSASWSPDGLMVVLEVWGRDGLDIARVNLDGSDFRLLTTDTADDKFPDWSPDGKTIAFQSFREGAPHIYLMDSDGGNQRRLTNADMVEIEPDWSPDGQKIAFVSGDNVNTHLYLVNKYGTDLIQLTNSVGYNESPSWSPDGAWIAFWSNRTGNREIYLIRADGSEEIQITYNEFDDENPSWSK